MRMVLPLPLVSSVPQGHFLVELLAVFVCGCLTASIFRFSPLAPSHCVLVVFPVCLVRACERDALVRAFLPSGACARRVARACRYVASFDFTGCSIVAGLRKYMESFRAPGEAQKVRARCAALCSARRWRWWRVSVRYLCALWFVRGFGT